MRVDEEGLENFDDYLSESGTCSTYDMSLFVRKPVFEVSDQVRHKPGCEVTEDG